MAEQIKPDPGVLKAQKQAETTLLSPMEEYLFKAWGKAHQLEIEDVDAPESAYDFRGFFKATNGAVHPPGSVEHFPDTFKQHGNPTFSTDSIYSKGPQDGGQWDGEQYVPQPDPPAPAEDPIRAMIDLMKERNKAKSEANKGRSIDAKAYESQHPVAKPVEKVDPVRAKIDVMKEQNKSRQLDVKEYDQKNPKPATAKARPAAKKP